MRAPLPPAAWASSSAFTSSRVPPTTWKRSFRSGESARLSSARCSFSLPAAQPPAQLLQRAFVPDDQHRLSRRFQQVEKSAALRARVDLAAVGEELHGAAAARCVEEPLAEPVVENPEQHVELMDGEAAMPQVGEDDQLEQ